LIGREEVSVVAENQVRWASGLNLLAGLWLVFSPLWFHYDNSGNVWQQVVLGVVVGLLAIGRMATPRVTWPSWVNLIIGIYFIIAPWTFSASASAQWNQFILGIIVGVLAIWSIVAGSSTERVGERGAAQTFGERVDRNNR
jgi:hypothetical protein